MQDGEENLILKRDELAFVMLNRFPYVNGHMMVVPNQHIAALDELDQAEVAGSGLVDESKRQQGRLQLNLLIFFGFLIAVIFWIFWVNRELIKERRALGEIEKEAKKEGTGKEDKPDDKKPPNFI